MIRAIVEQTFDQHKKYFVLAGTSSDSKPTSGLITGSEFHEVDTGIKYQFDEDSATWNAVGLTPDEIKAEIDAWLDDHPEATTTVQDGAISYAKLNSSLQGTVDEVSDLKSAVSAIERIIRQDDLNYNQISAIVTSGQAETYFSIGDQIMVKWNDGTNEYELPWDIVHFGNVELENGETVPGMYIQSHYAMQAVQFDASEAIYVASSTLPAGTYNFTIGSTWGQCVAGKVYQFTTTVDIPVGGQVIVGRNNDFWAWNATDVAPSSWRVHTFASNAATTPLESNLAVSEGSGGTALGSLAITQKYSSSGVNNLQRAGMGYNRWSQSAMRQYYNSAAAVGAWWSPQNPFDRAPQQLSTVRGFMAGFEEAFMNIIKPIKVVTALNTVSDADIGQTEATYDTFFLASLEQEYILPQKEGEGVYWEYWKQRFGLNSPRAQGTVEPKHIRYAYDNNTSAQNCRLRSANSGTAYLTWYISNSGGANSYANSVSAYRGCPACVIC